MALDLGTLVVNLTADAAKFDSTLSGAQGTVQRFTRGVGGQVQALGTIALGAAVGGVTVLGGALAVAGRRAISLGADANETASLLENSLGEAAQGLNSELRDFAENANRSFYELQAGSSTFVAMTRAMGATETEAADLSVGFVQMATDLGSFLNVSTDQALADLQGALAGSSETMQKYGIDVRETTLKQMALDQGLIDSASDTIPRLVRAQLIQQAIMEQGADAMGDAVRTSDSWQNTLRGLQGRLIDTATSIGQKLIPALAPLLSRLMDLVDVGLERFMPMIEGIIEAVGQFVARLSEGTSFLGSVQGLVYGLATALGLGADQAIAISSAVAGVIDWVMQAAGAISEFLAPVIEAVGQFVSWKDVLLALGIAIAAVVIPIIGGLAIAVGKIMLVFALVTAAVALVRNAWENNWGGVQEKTRAVIAFIQNIITTVVTAVRAFWEENGEAILASARRVWETIQQVVTTVINTVRSIIEAVTGAIRASWDAHGAEITASAQSFWTAVKDFINNTITFIRDGIIIPVATAIAAFWEAHGAAIVAGAQAAWEHIKNIIDIAMQNIAIILDVATALLRGDWTAFTDSMVALSENAWAMIRQAVQAFVDFFRPVIQAVIAEIKGALQPALDGLQAKFSSVFGAIEGVVAGVKGIWDGFVGAVQGFWNWLKGKVFNFSINLPSLPSWATPGSPLPIHTAWEAFARDMRNMHIAPRLDFALPGGGMAALPAGANGARPIAIHIDARGAQRGVGDEIETAVTKALARAGIKADARRRT